MDDFEKYYNKYFDKLIIDMETKGFRYEEATKSFVRNDE